MNNFGVIEVASTTTKNTPGWAYVPDTGPTPLAVAATGGNRKRAARNQPALSLSDLTARQENKIRKDIEALDRDNQRDIAIPIPQRSRTSNKHTPNVRKILTSQKTFANHLDDYRALQALAETNPAAAAQIKQPATPTVGKSASPAPSTPAAAPSPAAAGGTATSKRGAAAAKRAAAKEREAQRRQERERAKKAKKKEEEADATQQGEGEGDQENAGAEDVEMADAPVPEDQQAGTEESSLQQHQEQDATKSQEPSPPPPPPPPTYPPDGTILPAYKGQPPPAPHPGDDDELLVSRVPPFPTDEELKALMTAPPLSYFQARAEWGEEERRYPTRVFCEVCGYWGRVKCIKCGVRVCALDCLNVHREECITRYGI